MVKEKPLYVFGEASVKDDDEVKILARSLGELNENSEEQETLSNDGENPKSVTYQNSETVYGASVPEKLYIRIRNMKCREFERVMSVIDIFSEQGRTDVVFYDSEQGKYVKINSKITLTPSVIGILVEICGKDNVVVK